MSIVIFWGLLLLFLREGRTSRSVTAANWHKQIIKTQKKSRNFAVCQLAKESVICYSSVSQKKVLLSLCNLHMRRNGWRIHQQLKNGIEKTPPKKNKFSSAPFLGRSAARSLSTCNKNVPSTNHRISSLCAINYKKEFYPKPKIISR